MAKKLRGPWITLKARRPGRIHLAFAIPPGTMVADWGKFSAKVDGNRGLHRSPQFDWEEYRDHVHPPFARVFTLQ